MSTSFEAQALLSVDDWSNQAAPLSSRLVSWPASRQRSASDQAGPIPGINQGSDQTAMQGGPVLTAMMGSLALRMTSRQLAASLLTVENVASELKLLRDPQATQPQLLEALADAAQVNEAESFSLEVAEFSLVAVSDVRTELQLAESAYLAAPSGGPVQLLLGAPCVRVGFKTGWPHREAQLFASMISPLAWGSPNFGLYIPIIDVYLGTEAQSPSLDSGTTLVAQTGTVLPTVRVGIKSSALQPGCLDCGTKVPKDLHVCLTIRDTQAEVSMPASPENDRLAARKGTNDPAHMLINIAVASAVADIGRSQEQYQALISVATIFRKPIKPPRKDSLSDWEDSIMPIRLHVSLAAAQGVLHCPKSENSAVLSPSVDPSSLDLSFSMTDWVVHFDQNSANVRSCYHSHSCP